MFGDSLHSHPIVTRSDLQRLFRTLWDPLATYRSTSGARIRLGFPAGHFEHGDMNGLEIVVAYRGTERRIALGDQPV
jgi:hypothetical protein